MQKGLITTEVYRENTSDSDAMSSAWRRRKA
jgi:hypothetical protein